MIKLYSLITLISTLITVSLPQARAAEVERNRIQYPELGPAGNAGTSASLVNTKPTVQALLVPGNRNQRLQSTAFEGETPTGSLLGAELSVSIPHQKRQSRLGFIFDQSEYRYLPAALNPAKISEGRFQLSYENLTSGSDWNWGFALQAEKTTATQTSPNPLVASRSMGRLGLVSSYTPVKQSTSIWAPDFRGALLIPLVQKESSAESGEFQNGVRLETRVLFQSGVFYGGLIQLGLELNIEQLQYSGIGERGSHDAKEVRTDLRFPVGLLWTWD